MIDLCIDPLRRHVGSCVKTLCRDASCTQALCSEIVVRFVARANDAKEILTRKFTRPENDYGGHINIIRCHVDILADDVVQ